MMSKKDHAAIAAILRKRFGVDDLGHPEWRRHADWTIRLLAGDLENYMATQSPHFSRDRFREACGFECIPGTAR